MGGSSVVRPGLSPARLLTPPALRLKQWRTRKRRRTGLPRSSASCRSRKRAWPNSCKVTLSDGQTAIGSWSAVVTAGSERQYRSKLLDAGTIVSTLFIISGIHFGMHWKWVVFR